MNSLNNEPITPTPEEHAYNLGWVAFFEEHGLSCNIYNCCSERDLFDKWVDGYTTAKTIHNALLK